MMNFIRILYKRVRIIFHMTSYLSWEKWWLWSTPGRISMPFPQPTWPSQVHKSKILSSWWLRVRNWHKTCRLSCKMLNISTQHIRTYLLHRSIWRKWEQRYLVKYGHLEKPCGISMRSLLPCISKFSTCMACSSSVNFFSNLWGMYKLPLLPCMNDTKEYQLTWTRR